MAKTNRAPIPLEWIVARYRFLSENRKADRTGCRAFPDALWQEAAWVLEERGLRNFSFTLGSVNAGEFGKYRSTKKGRGNPEKNRCPKGCLRARGDEPSSGQTHAIWRIINQKNAQRPPARRGTVVRRRGKLSSGPGPHFTAGPRSRRLRGEVFCPRCSTDAARRPRRRRRPGCRRGRWRGRTRIRWLRAGGRR